MYLEIIDNFLTKTYHKNLLELLSGSNFNWKKASFILGFENTVGYLNDTKSLMKVNGAENKDILGFENGTMDYRIFSFGLFLGFSLGF